MIGWYISEHISMPPIFIKIGHSLLHRPQYLISATASHPSPLGHICHVGNKNLKHTGTFHILSIYLNIGHSSPRMATLATRIFNTHRYLSYTFYIFKHRPQFATSGHVGHKNFKHTQIPFLYFLHI